MYSAKLTESKRAGEKERKEARKKFSTGGKKKATTTTTPNFGLCVCTKLNIGDLFT